MTVIHKILLFFVFALPLSARGAVFSGEVRSADAQSVFVPASNFSIVTLRFYIPDGTPVKKGDVILRVDAGQADAQIRAQTTQIEQVQATSAKEVAELQLKAVKAEIGVVDAEAALSIAKIDAGLPPDLVSDLDADRYRNELDRARRDLVFKQEVLADAEAAVSRRRDDAKLEVEKLEIQRRFNQSQANAAEVRADRSGVVIHAFSTFAGAAGRIDEGSSTFIGQEVGEVVTNGNLMVRAWVLEPDRADLSIGGNVQLVFDALAGRALVGTITKISGAPQSKPEWGEGSYFVVDINLADAKQLLLKPGMSVRVDTAPKRDLSVISAGAHSAQVSVVRAPGEIYAQTTSTVSPPEVENLWQLTISQMAPDGAFVRKGEFVVAFDATEVGKNLSENQNKLLEKVRAQESLRLELAERARLESLATKEAAADVTKAQRKADQPQEYIPNVEFKKLLITRQRSEVHLKLAEKNERAASDERAAEQRMIDTEVARLQGEVKRLQTAMGQLTVAAPRDGTFLHGMSWDGKKIDNGTQVWRGQSIAEIPDLTTLAVRASLDERDLERVQRGDSLRVIVDGGARQTMSGRIDSLGFAIHSKSRVEPVPVIDLRVALDANNTTLKPGQSVQVEIAPTQSLDRKLP